MAPVNSPAVCELDKIQINGGTADILQFNEFVVRVRRMVHNLGDAEIINNRVDNEGGLVKSTPVA